MHYLPPYKAVQPVLYQKLCCVRDRSVPLVFSEVGCAADPW